MKVLFITYWLGLTGGSVTFSELSKALVKRGYKVVFVTLGNEYKTWFYNNVEIISVPRYDRGRFGEGASRNLLNLIRLARSVEDVDVKVATSWATPFPALFAKSETSIYYAQHLESLFYDNQVLKMGARSTYYLPYFLIANSTWLKERLSEIGRSSFLVLPALWYPESFHPPKNGAEKSKVPSIIALGKSDKIKGLRYLVEALDTIRKEIPSVELTLYGREPSLAETYNCKYVYSPSNDQLASLYSSASVAVIPSLFESFPYPPLEAMACGTPVVTTRYGTEDYAFNDINSLVVPPKDPKTLANAIIRILKDQSLSERLSKEGIRTAGLFTLDKSCSMFENALRAARA